MKIVHLANHAQTIGNGTVNMMVDLACVQARAGHDVVVASSGGGFEPLLRRHGINHVLLQQSRQPWRVPSMVAGFNRLIDRFDPDIVHAHMMTGALVSRFAGMRRRFALVTTVHHEFHKSPSIVRTGDRMVAVSDAVAAALVERGVVPERLSVVRQRRGRRAAPDLPAARASRAPEASQRAERGGHVSAQGDRGSAARVRTGALASGTGARVFKEPHLYLVGDGPERVSMEELAAQLGIAESVHFTGFVADPRPYLAQTDVFALASLEDPCPLVLSEAREAGCAIVGTRVGGIPELLDGGTAGVLVAPGDPEQLAMKLRWLLMDTHARAELGARAKRNLEGLSVDRVAHEYMAIYQRTLAERASIERRQGAPRTHRAPDGAV